MKTKLLLLFLAAANLMYGQVYRAAHWYFGYQAGIDFSSGLPVTDTTGNLASIEGCSSISDTSGNLLFYSNGEAVWNRNNDTMPNSPGLIGDQSSAESSLIVPLPNSATEYYLFQSAGSNSNAGLRYSIIDMSLDGGLGDINASKNILLFNSGTEELAGTKHCNATDYWIVGRKSATDTLKFYSYLLSSSGLSNPVISEFNLANPWWNTVGCLTFSQDGNTLCFSSIGTAIYIFDFNKQTGQLTIRDTITQRFNEQVIANAISPDATKFYLTSWTPFGYSLLSQFDLTATNITSTRFDIDSVDYTNGSPNGYGFIGQVRLAPDQRIYVTRWNQDHPYQVNPDTYYSLDSIDVIHNPDLAGSSCNFQRDFLYLNHKPTMLGLPNFVSNFTSLVAPLSNCETGIVTYSTGNSDFEIYPNPFLSETTLKTKKKFMNATFTIYNSFGEEIRRTENISGQEIKLTRDNLPAGIYFVHLTQGNKIIGMGKLIIAD